MNVTPQVLLIRLSPWVSHVIIFKQVKFKWNKLEFNIRRYNKSLNRNQASSHQEPQVQINQLGKQSLIHHMMMLLYSKNSHKTIIIEYKHKKHKIHLKWGNLIF